MVYEGEGYWITSVFSESTYLRRFGPEITISPAITAGCPFHYSEVSEEHD
ncbi:MAG: hypothetical protein K1X78_10085 [Verrucomicrobiaceae bacterium]|nr:hypothetical protein [Verrucomicrobiaceae bacterium]